MYVNGYKYIRESDWPVTRITRYNMDGDMVISYEGVEQLEYLLLHKCSTEEEFNRVKENILKPIEETIDKEIKKIRKSKERFRLRSTPDADTTPVSNWEIEEAIEKIKLDQDAYDFKVDGNKITYSVDRWTLSNGYSGTDQYTVEI